jgi:hypothetical protein
MAEAGSRAVIRVVSCMMAAGDCGDLVKWDEPVRGIEVEMEERS